jgi:hypothetical protein
MLPAVAILLAIAACGGDDDDETDGGTGQITDPRTVPTATPWDVAPDAIILDPDNLTPLSGGEGIGAPDDGDDDDSGDGGDGGDGDGADGGDDGSSGPPPGECGNDTYTIAAGDTISGIAERCDLATQDILDANPGIDPAGLHIGDVINLP